MKRHEQVAQHGWDQSHPLDLSDSALLANLQKRDLDPGKPAWHEDIEPWGCRPNGHPANGAGKSHDRHAATDNKPQ